MKNAKKNTPTNEKLFTKILILAVKTKSDEIVTNNDLLTCQSELTYFWFLIYKHKGLNPWHINFQFKS